MDVVVIVPRMVVRACLRSVCFIGDGGELSGCLNDLAIEMRLRRRNM